MNYILPEFLISSTADENSISDERDYYAVWEKQRGNQFWANGGYYRIIQPGIRNHYFVWFSLPVQPDGKYTRHLQIMGYEHKINFGIQQGLIKLNQQLCEADLCHVCPFLQIESRS